ncbi:FadR/GntR family transcriptional regulator [Gemmobacter sp.]|uniref:FadR/GntR family transcriptional regulator n=1 Tax=Gemmobacter sp. TaxID=1898957 RepID=UPI002B002CF2|nr:FCD domain-containing protein [Gemmobacter sp.]
MIEPVIQEKSFEALASQIKAQIMDGSIAAGEMLNERALIDLSGLSRGSVREALRVLETQGLVETRRGRNGGWVVVRPGTRIMLESLASYIRQGNPTLRVLMETVEMFEPAMAALAARHRTREDIAAMAEAIGAMENAPTSEAFIQMNGRWHVRLADSARNPIIAALYRALGPSLLDPRVEGFVTAEVRANVIHASRAILQAITDQDERLAADRMRKHVAAYFQLLARLDG